MAGKKKAEYENALQSISDFIFKNSGKRVKLKPGKITGASGADRLASTLAEIASKPGVYISESMMKSINDTLGSPAWLQFHVDKLNQEKHIGTDPNSSRFRVRNQETGSFIANPRKYVKGIFDNAKAERDWAAKVGFAGYADGAVALLWAKRKAGLSWSDSMKLFSAASHDLQPIHREEAHQLVAETAAYETFDKKDRAKEAGEDLYKAINSSKLTRSGKASVSTGSLGRKFEQTLSYSERDLWKKGTSGAALVGDNLKVFQSLQARQAQFGSSGDKYSGRYKQLEGYLYNLKDSSGTRKYTPAEILGLLDRYVETRDISKIGLTGSEMKGIDNISDISPTTYRRMLSRNLEAKLKLQDPSKDMDEITRISKSLGIVGLWQRAYGSPSAEYYDDLVGKINAEINKPTITTGRKSQLEALLGEVSKEAAVLGNRRGSYLGAYTGVTSVPVVGQMRKDLSKYIDKELQFWSIKLTELNDLKRQGTISSDQYKELQEAARMIGVVRTERAHLKTLPWAGARITVGQVSNMFRTFKTVFQGGAGGALATGMFWVSDLAGPLAPGVVDDFFVHLSKGGAAATKYTNVIMREDIHPAYSRLASLYYISPSSILKTVLWNGEGWTFGASLRQMAAQNILKANAGDIATVLGITQDEFMGRLGKNYLDVVDQLKGINNPIIKKFIGRVDSLSQTAVWMGKVGDFYATHVAGLYNKIGGNIRGKIMGVVQKFLKGKLNSEIWNKAVDGFVAGSLGIKQLIRAGVEAIIMSLNITVSGGSLSMLVGIISYAVTEGIYKFAQPLMEVLAGVFAVLGILVIALIIGIIGFFGSNFAADSDPYRSYIPGEAIACVDTSPYKYLFPEDNVPSFGSGKIPPDSACPFKKSVLCSQGGRASIISGYHKTRMSFDATSSGEASIITNIWHAPSDGKVTHYTPNNYDCIGGGNSGGELHFVDGEGNKYILKHVRAIASLGPVTKGKAVAKAQGYGENISYSCWDGPHYHLDVMVNDKFVDSVIWYRDGLKCNVVFNLVGYAHCAGY